MKKKLRIKKSALNLKQNKLYYKNKLFTGVFFELKNNHIIDSEIVKNGKIMGKYQNKYFKNPKNALHIDSNSDELDGDTQFEKLKFKDADFTGIIYEFSDEFCIFEEVYLGGWGGVETGWHKNGNLNHYFNWDGKTRNATFQFDENNNVRSIHIRKTKDTELRVTIEKNKKISDINLSVKYFSTPDAFVVNLPFQIINSETDFYNYHADTHIYLSKNGITPKLFDKLNSKGFFKNVESIRLLNTPILPKQIKTISTFTKLKKISITDDHGKLGLELLKLKRKRPKVIVDYNFELTAKKIRKK